MMKKLLIAAVCGATMLAQPAAAALFRLDFTGVLLVRSSPNPASVTPSPFSGFLEYEGGTDGNRTTTNGTSTLFTDQYGPFNFNAYSATLTDTRFIFASTQMPGFSLNATRSGNGPYSGNFSITAAPTLNGAGSLSGDFGQMTSAVPEPAVWAMLVIGFGMVGTFLRRRPVKGLRTSYAR